LENIPLISSFNIPHPITSEIDILCYRSGCSLSIIGSGAFSIADSNETSEPFSCPLICVSESEKGRVCCIGSYEMFRDNIGGGFQCKEHPKLTLNIFQWLVSDYRMELRGNADLPVPIPQTYNDTSPLSKQQIYSTNSIQIDKKSKDVSFSLKISNKSELIELLKNLQGQINNSKTIIDRLVEIALTSKDEITEQEVARLTTLPPKPESLKKATVETNSELSLKPAPKLKTKAKVETNSELSLKPPPKLKTKAKSPKELKDEKQGLETKLSSVEDLMKFVDKKHSSGKINDDDYKKQSKKLQNNFKKTKKKIDIIKKLLEK